MTRSPSHLVPLIAFFLAVPAAAQVAFEDQVLVPLQGGPYDGYGERIEIDGDRLLVGSRGLVGASFQPASQVVVPLAYVYDRAPDGTWQLAAELDPTAPAFPSSGLHDVALDGDWAFVRRQGSPPEPLHVYHRDALGSWGLSQSLPPGGFGWGQSFDADDGTLVIAAPAPVLPGTNRLELYARDPSGTYVLTSVVEAPVVGGAELSFFGSRLDLDGERLVAADSDEVPGALGDDHLFEVERASDGTWSVTGEIALPPGGFDDLALDGDRLALVEENAAWVLQRDPSGAWTPAPPIEAEFPTAFIDGFGLSIDLEGEWLAVGAPNLWKSGTFDPGEPQVGGAYLYREAGPGDWRLVTRVASSDTAASTKIGRGIALGDHVLAVGGSEQHLPPGAAGSAIVVDLGTLFHGEPRLSVSAGGVQDLLLRAGPDHAGELYLVLGSLSGTEPGTPVPGTALVLPLVLDAYTSLGLTTGSLVTPFFGTLDADGYADAAFLLPAGLSPSVVGLVAYHAFVSSLPSGSATSASNPVRVEAVP